MSYQWHFSEILSKSQQKYNLKLYVQAWAKNVTSGKLSKSDKLGQVDHSTIDYPPFRRNFYIEAQEIQMMTEKQVADYRLQLDDIKVRGRDVPRPVKNWAQCGLTGRTMDVMKKNGFTNPMPIQVRFLHSLLCGSFEFDGFESFCVLMNSFYPPFWFSCRFLTIVWKIHLPFIPASLSLSQLLLPSAFLSSFFRHRIVETNIAHPC